MYNIFVAKCILLERLKLCYIRCNEIVIIVKFIILVVEVIQLGHFIRDCWLSLY